MARKPPTRRYRNRPPIAGAIEASMSPVQSFPPIVSPQSQATYSRLHAWRSVAESRSVLRAPSECILARPSLPYQERIATLQSIGVALWDSLQACIRPGSLDASIKEEVANDFPALFAKYPNITHVFFNGSKAERSFLRHTTPTLSEDHHAFARLPSTSPAHAAMRLEAKVQAWSVVKNVVS